ncbi:DUF1788 domain-containing protein [Aquitalea sp. USM4]|uniref:DUF1788 domain-containing protein n=1 Tax=Aquitalea sp. USM4 TaxID=1590041 RepID=UPI00103A0BFA|nr:DUF1788 domain-containing protein [Aquitalea sp. USM4]QBJ76908.1 DUF1788 domain-containing protein [Aquitalea sp. USM4]
MTELEKQRFHDRLNQILPRLTSDDLLKNRGLGNEIGFHVFDYPAECEEEMRDFVSTVIEPNLAKQGLRFHTVNLFDLSIQLLQERKLLDKAITMQREKGNDAAMPGLRSVLKEDKLAKHLTEKIDVGQQDLVLMTGVGAAYPMVRLHTLLSALHAHMSDTPLVIFYPGRYDGVSLRLFGLSAERNDANAAYYRAFQLLKSGN